MKKFFVMLLFFICAFATIGPVNADDIPRRYATQVQDVTQAYEPEEWIISPDERQQ